MRLEVVSVGRRRNKAYTWVAAFWPALSRRGCFFSRSCSLNHAQVEGVSSFQWVAVTLCHHPRAYIYKVQTDTRVLLAGRICLSVEFYHGAVVTAAHGDKLRGTSWTLSLHRGSCTALQSRKAVTAYLKKTQLLPFGFATAIQSQKAVTAHLKSKCYCLLALQSNAHVATASVIRWVICHYCWIHLDSVFLASRVSYVPIIWVAHVTLWLLGAINYILYCAQLNRI